MIRSLGSLLLVVLVLVVPTLVAPIARVAAAPESPNIVVILLDDMREEDWKALPRTKQLLEPNGTWYPNFFVSTPVCCPSRVSILSGQYPHNSGVWANAGSKGGWRNFRNKTNTIASALDRAGYTTGMFGKFVHGYGSKRAAPGWDRWWMTFTLDYTNFKVSVNGKIKKVKRYYTTEQSRQARSFVSSARGPFFLYLSSRAPHGPSTPEKRFAGDYRGTPLEPNPARNEADVSDKPAFVRNASRVPDRWIRSQNQRRLESLKSVDLMVANLVESVRKSGRLDNTIFFVLSDNGVELGEHRVKGKAVPYDGSIRIPMLVSGPGFDRDGANDNRLVGNVDIAPTIARAAGVDLPWADGRPLQDNHERDVFLLEHIAWRGLRGADFLYVEWNGGEREYYDHTTDPHELDNMLATWSGHTPTLDPVESDRLRQLLADLGTCTGQSCP